MAGQRSTSSSSWVWFLHLSVGVLGSFPVTFHLVGFLLPSQSFGASLFASRSFDHLLRQVDICEKGNVVIVGASPSMEVSLGYGSDIPHDDSSISKDWSSTLFDVPLVGCDDDPLRHVHDPISASYSICYEGRNTFNNGGSSSVSLTPESCRDSLDINSLSDVTIMDSYGIDILSGMVDCNSASELGVADVGTSSSFVDIPLVYGSMSIDDSHVDVYNKRRRGTELNVRQPVRVSLTIVGPERSKSDGPCPIINSHAEILDLSHYRRLA